MLPKIAKNYLKMASTGLTPQKEFSCQVFGPEFNSFIEDWAPKIHSYLIKALGPFGTEPLPEILPMSEGMHMSGATASFDMRSGQIELSPSIEGNPGQALEKMTHEMTHGSYSQFPSEDPFYDEGYVDFSTWVLVHAPLYGEYRQQAIDAAAYNIKMRRERALRNLSDYDRKRWAGGVFASVMHGPMILHYIKSKKNEKNYKW